MSYRNCLGCGNELDPNSAQRKYCSVRCAGGRHRMKTKPLVKKCTKCGKMKPYTAKFFGSNRSKKSTFGLIAQCKTCVSVGARERNKLYQARLRKQVLTAYGDGKLACACCGEAHYEFLCLDHVKGGGGKERQSGLSSLNLLYKLRREGFPPGYRVLCANCNMAYGLRGVCPHQSESSSVVRAA